MPTFVFDPSVSANIQFGRTADCYLEIGFGGGEHLAGLAAAMPDCDFIGAEPFINGVASLLRHIDEQQLGNIRIWPDDVRLILPKIETASLAGAFIMFPDPWPKRRHAGRRILQPAFLDQLATIIRPGANWCLLVMIQRQKVGCCRLQLLILGLSGQQGARVTGGNVPLICQKHAT